MLEIQYLFDISNKYRKNIVIVGYIIGLEIKNSQTNLRTTDP